MKILPLLCCASILFFSCGGPPKGKVPDLEAGNFLIEEFQLALANSKEIVFIDSSKMGAAIDGSILNLHFFPNSKMKAWVYGNGFSEYRGTFVFPGNNRVEIHLEKQIWPELILSKNGDHFLLTRTDGLRSLTKYFYYKNDDGTRSLGDDGDIYPGAESKIFPFTQK